MAVVDDEALVRRGLPVLLRLEPGLDVVGEAEDGAGAIDRPGAPGHPDAAGWSASGGMPLAGTATALVS